MQPVRNVAKAMMIKAFFLSAAIVVNAAILLMVGLAISGEGEGGAFPFELKGNLDLHFSSFLSPIIVIAACCVGLVGDLRRKRPSWLSALIPALALLAVLLVNYLLVGNVGFVALSGPFVLAATVVGFMSLGNT